MCLWNPDHITISQAGFTLDSESGFTVWRVHIKSELTFVVQPPPIDTEGSMYTLQVPLGVICIPYLCNCQKIRDLK